MSETPDNDSKLGHDPLDWLKEDNSEAAQEVSNSTENDADSIEEESIASADTEKSEALEESDTELATSKQEQDDTQLFEGGLTVAQMEALKPNVVSVIDALPDGAEWSVDFSHVTQIDSSGYQLMISLLNACEAKQVTVCLLGLTQEVKSQLELLGDQRLLASLKAA